MENSSSSDNLDDGELWLPSDIFPVEEPVAATNKLKNNNPIITSSICYCYSCLLLHRHHNEQQEEAAISLLQHHSTHSFPKSFPITERRFRPAERFCSCTDCSVLEYLERNKGGRELLRTGPPPVHSYQLYPPVQLQNQVESLIEARARILQMQEKNRFAQNRFLPFVGCGGGGGGGSGSGGFDGGSSSMRDYGGTGVFLPRIPTNIDNNGRTRQGGRNREDVQQNGQRYPCI